MTPVDRGRLHAGALALLLGCLVAPASAGTDHSGAFHDRLDSLVALADSLRGRESDGPGALRVLERAVAESRALGDTLHEAVALTHHGRALASLGRAKQAESVLEQAIALAAPRDTTTLCEALFQHAFAVSAQGQLPRALPLYQRLIDIAQAAGDSGYAARGAMLLGRANMRQGDFQGARANFEIARQGFRTVGDSRNELNVVYLGANLEASTGNGLGARSGWLNSLRLARRVGSRTIEAGSLANLGTYEVLTGDPNLAFEYWRSAYEIYLKEGRKRAAIQPALNASNALVLIGRYSDAQDLLEELLEQTREEGYRDLEARALSDLGLCALQRDRAHEAHAYYRQAEAILEGSKLSEFQGIAMLGVARSLAKMDSVEAALTYLEDRSRHLLPRIAFDDRIQVQTQIARLRIDLGREAEAIGLLHRMEREARTRDLQRHVMTVLVSLARAYDGLGRPDSALAVLERAADEWAAGRRLSRDPEWREEWGSKGASIYTDLAVLQLDRDDGWTDPERAGEVYDMLQRFKSRTLLERMRDPLVAKDGTELQATPTTLGHLQREVLREDEVLLDCFLGPRVSLVFAVTRNTCAVHRVTGDEGALRARLQLYRKLLEHRPRAAAEPDDPSGLMRAGSVLGELLFGPHAGVLSQKRGVLFVPDGALNLIPLEALRAPPAASGGAWRPMWQWDVSRFPSATALAWVRERDAGEGDDLPAGMLAVAGGVTSAGDRLAGARTEVERLHSRYQRVDVWSGGNRAPPIQPVDLARYDKLHIAAHTVLDDQRPWRSGILLSDTEHVVEPATWGQDGDGDTDPEASIIRASSISRTPMRASLVVLSGCETAGGRVASGEGVLGLTSAFFSSGVPVAVATLWPVDDHVTVRLIDAFYDELADGNSVAVALREAQSTLRRDPRTAHPFYWAGFVIVGDGDVRVPLERRFRLTPFVWPALLLVLILAWAAVRKRSSGGRGEKPAGAV